MNIEKVANFFNNAKSIWGGILMLFMAAAWGGNQQWVQKSEYKEDQKILAVQQINREISELEIKLLYTSEQQQKAMMQALIIQKKTQIKNIKESQQ